MWRLLKIEPSQALIMLTKKKMIMYHSNFGSSECMLSTMCWWWFVPMSTWARAYLFANSQMQRCSYEAFLSYNISCYFRITYNSTNTNVWCWHYNTFCQAGKCKGVAWRHATSYKRAAEENIDRGVTTGQEKMYSSDEGKRNKLTSYTHSMGQFIKKHSLIMQTF